MSDIVKTSYTLKIIAGFTDEDDRILTIDNPRSNLTWSDISANASLAANVLIGDKYAAPFSRFKEAKYVSSTVRYVDTENPS